MPVLWDWALQQDYAERWMPEPTELRQVFLGEYPHAQSYQEQFEPHYGRESWKITRGHGRGNLPVPVHETAEDYVWERNHSGEESTQVLLPTDLLIHELNLEWQGEVGKHYHNNELAVVDPSGWCRGPSALLIRRDVLLTLLQRGDYDIVWTLLGEQQFMGGFDRRKYIGKTIVSANYRLTNTGEFESSWRPRFQPPTTGRKHRPAFPITGRLLPPKTKSK